MPLRRARRRVLALLLVLAAAAATLLLLPPRAPAGPARPAHPFFAGRPTPLVFAHRGGAGLAPENTLAAFLASHAQNPAWVQELDVRATRDGALVVLHDRTVDRTTDGTGRVDQLTLEEVRRLDAGYCAQPGVRRGTAPSDVCHARDARPADFPFRGKGVRIPTLREVLDALPRSAAVSVEVKDPGFEDRVARELRASGRLGNLVVGSGTAAVAERLAALLPEAAHFLPAREGVCLGLGSRVPLLDADCGGSAVFATPPSTLGVVRLDTPALLAAAHARGIRVAYWTINDEAELERLVRLGADGVITDYPDRAQRVVDRVHGLVPTTGAAP